MDHSPISFLAQYTSMVRNTLSIGALAIAVISASAFFGKTHDQDVFYTSMVVMGILLFIYGVVYGYKGAVDFHRYLSHIESRMDDLPEVYRLQIKQWRGWVYLQVVFLAALVVLTFVSLAFVKTRIISSPSPVAS